MTKLKSAESWINDIEASGLRMLSAQAKMLLLVAVKDIQRNAIEAALETAASQGKLSGTDEDCAEYRCCVRHIDKESITSLINHENLKV